MSPIAVPIEEPKATTLPSKVDISALPNVNSSAPFLNDLKTKGWCVVPSVIPQERLGEYENDAYTWLENFGRGFKRNDKFTWTEENLPISGKGGLYNKYHVNHEDWVWRARKEPGVVNAFKELWGTDELIVSFDGMNVTFPYGPHGRTDVELTPPWPHQDQDPYNPAFQLAQGIIAISPSGPNDGGLCVCEGSHLKHNDFFAANGGIDQSRIPKGKLNSYHYKSEEHEWYRQNGCKDIKVECPAGSVIIWDSRLIHWNCMPTGDITRIATYACYCPRKFADEAALSRKAELFKNRWSTTHWPALNDMRQLNDPPERNGKVDPSYTGKLQKEPVEDEATLRLAGVMAY